MTLCSPPALDCGYPHAMGYTVRTPEWRYTEWVGYNNGACVTTHHILCSFSCFIPPSPPPFTVTYTPNWDVPFTEGGTVWRELYDHRGDMGSNWQDFEHANVAADPANAATVAQLSAVLRRGPNLLHPQELE